MRQRSRLNAADLRSEWQKRLYREFDEFAKQRFPDEGERYFAYLYFIAEVFRWARNEEGWDPDELGNYAAGMAILFPRYGGHQ